VESLQTKFNGAKANNCISLFSRWVPLTQCHDSLAVCLRIKGDGGTKTAGVVISV
jgi:hypothetical protein